LAAPSQSKSDFTVLTVTLNNLSGLRRTAESIAAQTCQDFTWLVIDGGSNDGTIEFLKQTPAARWVSAPDRGIYDAMNKGLKTLPETKNNADYALFLNAGDALAAPDTLQNIQNRIRLYTEKRSALPDFVYGDALEQTNTQPLHYKPARSHKQIASGMFTHHQAMLYRTEMLGAMRYDLSYSIAADYDFTIRFLHKTNKILYCPFTICVFAAGGVSQQNAAKGRREQFMIRHQRAVVSPPVNLAITISQALLWQVRQKMPWLYWRLKSSGNTASGSAPE
jgi:putative colanic acid biosynthesis glycosyltransferase